MHFSRVLLSALLFCTIATYADSASSSTTTLADSSSTVDTNNNNTENPISGDGSGEIEDEEEETPFQPSLDAISVEWQQICDMGCQPGTWPSDAKYISEYVVPELIAIQYKPTCSAKSAHMKYFREIFECSGRRDLCKDLDKKTMKCRDQAMRKVTSALKHIGESAMDCEKDEEWQDDFYGSILDFMHYYKSNVCRGLVDGELRDCKMMVSISLYNILFNTSFFNC